MITVLAERGNRKLPKGDCESDQGLGFGASCDRYAVTIKHTCLESLVPQRNRRQIWTCYPRGVIITNNGECTPPLANDTTQSRKTGNFAEKRIRKEIISVLIQQSDRTVVRGGDLCKSYAQTRCTHGFESKR